MSEESRRENEIRSARQQLIDQGLVRASVPASLVAEEIEQSWRRSVSHHVDPSGYPHVPGEIDPDSTILRAAGRILDQWQSNLTDSRMALFLADEKGRIISRRIIDAQDGKALDRANAAEGFDFSEHSLGTNGLGTPIEARGVVFVRGHEHFNDGLAQLACAGAPIKHPITGRIVGSLSIASHIDVASPLMVAMAKQAGHQIAEALEQMAASRDLELARTYRSFRSSRNPVLVMNSETVMTDMPALAHFDAESHADLWETLRRHRWDQDKLQLELPSLGTEATVRRLGPSGQDAIFALEFKDLTGAATRNEGITVDTPRTAVAPGRLEGSDGTTSHGSTADPYAAVQRQLTASAATPGLMRVIGGRSVGKRFQSSIWLRQHTGQEPEIFSAQEMASGSCTRVRAEIALGNGRGIIVVGGNDLSSELRADLENLAENAYSTFHPGARIILTELTNSAELTEGGTAPVAAQVPSLTELRDDLLDIVRTVAGQLWPGTNLLRVSPAALQRLLAWDWPENVAELRRILVALPHLAGGGILQAKDLPEAMRQTSWSTLSRYEQGERGTIIGALREADGNKLRAAELLGIGRTTLYRKMRTLKINVDEQTTTPGS